MDQKQLLEKLNWLNEFHTRDKIDLLTALEEHFGEVVIEVVEKVEANKARLMWRQIAETAEGNSIDDLIRLLWEPLKAKGFEFTAEKVEGGVQMKCTKCPIAELAQRLGGRKWLLHHTCNADPHIAAGFNPQIGLKRSKTLMEGDEFCDHLYYRIE